jgi:hypothetical protein
MASFAFTVFERMTSDISRLSAISSLVARHQHEVARRPGEAESIQATLCGPLDLLLDLRAGRKPARHHVAAGPSGHWTEAVLGVARICGDPGVRTPPPFEK